MPLRIEDLDWIQTAAKDGLSSLIRGLIGTYTSCIVEGLNKTESDDHVHVSEGILFIEDELFYLPPAIFDGRDIGTLYATADFTTAENRTFHDAATHNVWDVRNYLLGYASDGHVPSGSINLENLLRLSEIQLKIVIDAITLQNNFVGYDRVYYLTGFTPATGYGSIRIEKNNAGFMFLIGAFNATISHGKLGILPLGSRPVGDYVGHFFNASVAPGVLKIKSNGEIWVSGAAMNNVNYITLLMPCTFEDPIAYSLPTSGGNTTKGADIDYVPIGMLNRVDFTAAEGQTTFIVTGFDLTDAYTFLLGGIVQAGSVRVGNMVTYSLGVPAGTLVTILN